MCCRNELPVFYSHRAHVPSVEGVHEFTPRSVPFPSVRAVVAHSPRVVLCDDAAIFAPVSRVLDVVGERFWRGEVENLVVEIESLQLTADKKEGVGHWVIFPFLGRCHFSVGLAV